MPYDKPLFLNEIYTSIQGETSLAGLPTTFIMLPGNETLSISEVVDIVKVNGCRCVCVKGGEPLDQSAVYPLTRRLCDLGYKVCIETGGTLSTLRIDPRARIFLNIHCLGSRMSDKNLRNNLKSIRTHDEVKFALCDERDYHYALELIDQHGLARKTDNLLVSPVKGELDPNHLIEWILRDKRQLRLTPIKDPIKVKNSALQRTL